MSLARTCRPGGRGRRERSGSDAASRSPGRSRRRRGPCSWRTNRWPTAGSSEPIVPVSGAGTVGKWRSIGAVLGFAVALGGGLVAWALIVRVLAPYRELLAEAVRVTGGPRGESEDRFLVETFRDTVRRLEESEAALRRRADELEVLAGVLTRGSSSGVVITEPGGSVRAANPAAREIVPSLRVGEPIPAPLAEAEREAHIGGRVAEVRRLPAAGGRAARRRARWCSSPTAPAWKRWSARSRSASRWRGSASSRPGWRTSCATPSRRCAATSASFPEPGRTRARASSRRSTRRPRAWSTCSSDSCGSRSRATFAEKRSI